MDLGITGRRAAVAAASTGLGLAAAVALAAEGVEVAICGRDRERVERAAAEHGLTPIVADVAGAEGAANFVRAARDTLGGLDILVTNGGGPPAGGSAAFDSAAYAAAFELNARAGIAMCLEAVAGMRAQQWGRIVAITSSVVRQSAPTLVLSATARAGYTAFLKTLALETAPDGITVNSVQPGYHETERLRTLLGGAEAVARAGTGVPVGRLGRPADFGATVAFLCSEPAGFQTGTAVLVDGGAFPGIT
jgi:3-oxoacyl-[acyl-carrier protein] reductase